jgi:hypothetical protein
VAGACGIAGRAFAGSTAAVENETREGRALGRSVFGITISHESVERGLGRAGAGAATTGAAIVGAARTSAVALLEEGSVACLAAETGGRRGFSSTFAGFSSILRADWGCARQVQRTGKQKLSGWAIDAG